MEATAQDENSLGGRVPHELYVHVGTKVYMGGGSRGKVGNWPINYGLPLILVISTRRPYCEFRCHGQRKRSVSLWGDMMPVWMSAVPQ